MLNELQKFEAAKKECEALNEESRKLSRELIALRERLAAELNISANGKFGLTSDAIKFNPEYNALIKKFKIAFSNSQNFNMKFLKVWKRELQEERRLKLERIGEDIKLAG